VTVLGGETADGARTLEQVLAQRRAQRSVQVPDRIAETRDGRGRSTALTGTDRGGHGVELTVQVRGFPAREQAGAPAAGDEERDGEAEPAGEECAGRMAHPRPHFRECLC
jgi:hypothetical protein